MSIKLDCVNRRSIDLGTPSAGMQMAGVGGLSEGPEETIHLLERSRQGERPIFVSVSAWGN